MLLITNNMNIKNAIQKRKAIMYMQIFYAIPPILWQKGILWAI